MVIVAARQKRSGSPDFLKLRYLLSIPAILILLMYMQEIWIIAEDERDYASPENIENASRHNSSKSIDSVASVDIRTYI